jgi:hypothetical protein
MYGVSGDALVSQGFAFTARVAVAAGGVTR